MRQANQLAKTMILAVAFWTDVRGQDVWQENQREAALRKEGGITDWTRILAI